VEPPLSRASLLMQAGAASGNWATRVIGKEMPVGTLNCEGASAAQCSLVASGLRVHNERLDSR